MKGSALLREMNATFWLAVVTRGLHFLTAIALARLLGARDFGAYGYAMGWVAVLSLASNFGFGQLLIREVSAYRTREAWSAIRGLIGWTDRIAVRIMFGLVAVAALAAWLIRARAEPVMLGTFWIALPLVPLLVLIRIRQSAVRGLGQVLYGQLAEGIVVPGLLLGLIVLAFLGLGARPSAPAAMALHVTAAATALLLSGRLLRRALPALEAPTLDAARTSAWLASALSFFFITGIQVVNGRADVLILGTLKGATSVGYYNAAARGAELVTLFLVIANLVLAPRFASLHAAGEHETLRKLVVRSTLGLFAISTPVAIVLIVAAPLLLSLFGAEYIAADRTLAILVVGQWVNAVAGPMLAVLGMTGRERIAAKSTAVSVVMNIGLNFTLIPRFGMEGAAVATAISVAANNAYLAWLVHSGWNRSPATPRTVGRP